MATSDQAPDSPPPSRVFDATEALPVAELVPERAPAPKRPRKSMPPAEEFSQTRTMDASGVEVEPPAEAGFAAGSLIGGRYRVVQFLARGGMGEVYEAEDLELGGTLALKTVLPHIAWDQRARERFRREIQLSRRVTHPNVCRLFDIGFHARTSSGAEEEQDTMLFLTMELLHGETLARRLRRVGRFTPAEALPLVRQMVEALDAAHQVGVIHRDFKTSNIMLVPRQIGVRGELMGDLVVSSRGGHYNVRMHTGEKASEGKGWDLRVVVTDFGLARSSVEGEAAAEAITQPGLLMGTPATIAPEQIEGSEVTVATDIYAFGVVLYEMLTGRLPFLADTTAAAVFKRLQELPPRPRKFVPDLPPAWEKALLGCLQRQPSRRFAEVTQILQLLEVPGRRRPKSVPASETPKPKPGARPAVQRSLAILGFRNITGREEAAWMSEAFKEMLFTELSRAGGLRVLPCELVDRKKRELALKEVENFGRETLMRIRRTLGSDLVMWGSYIALGSEAGGRLRFDLRLQDTDGAAPVVSLAETGTEAELFELVGRVASRLKKHLQPVV